MVCCLCRIGKHQRRTPLDLFAKHSNNSLTRAGKFEFLNVNFVAQLRKIAEQPFQGYTFRSEKRAFQPIHEITVQGKQNIFGHESLHLGSWGQRAAEDKER